MKSLIVYLLIVDVLIMYQCPFLKENTVINFTYNGHALNLT